MLPRYRAATQPAAVRHCPALLGHAVTKQLVMPPRHRASIEPDCVVRMRCLSPRGAGWPGGLTPSHPAFLEVSRLMKAWRFEIADANGTLPSAPP